MHPLGKPREDPLPFKEGCREREGGERGAEIALSSYQKQMCTPAIEKRQLSIFQIAGKDIFKKITKRAVLG